MTDSTKPTNQKLSIVVLSSAIGVVGQTHTYTAEEIARLFPNDEKVLVTGGIYNSTPPTLTDGQVGSFQFDSSSNLKVVSGTSTATNTTTTTTVGDSTSSVTLMAANTARKGVAIRNGSTAVLYVELGSPATTSSVIRLVQNAYYELPILAGGEIYRGIITGIWDSDAGGSAYISQSV